jgi:hypothetical protein
MHLEKEGDAMNKLFSNPVFQQSTDSTVGFNLVPAVNAFTTIFNPKSLDPQEEVKMQKLLFENFQLSGIPEEKENAKLTQDFQNIKRLTSEIKGIQKQNLVLIGERIDNARTILKSYKDGTFTKWLQHVFSSKQTGYNILAYYLFLITLPENLQEAFKSLPQKAAYVLASRDGDLQTKIEILQDKTIDSENILPTIREKLPLAETDKRKTKGTSLLLVENLLKTVEKLQVSKNPLNEELKEKLKTVRSLIDELLFSA